MSATAPRTAAPKTPQVAVSMAALLVGEVDAPFAGLLALAVAEDEDEDEACGEPSALVSLALMSGDSATAVIPVPFMHAPGRDRIMGSVVKVTSAHCSKTEIVSHCAVH